MRRGMSLYGSHGTCSTRIDPSLSRAKRATCGDTNAALSPVPICRMRAISSGVSVSVPLLRTAPRGVIMWMV